MERFANVDNNTQDLRGCSPEKFLLSKSMLRKGIEDRLKAGELVLGKDISYTECENLAREYKTKADTAELLKDRVYYRRLEGMLYVIIGDSDGAIDAFEDVQHSYIQMAQKTMLLENDGKAQTGRLVHYVEEYSRLIDDLEIEKSRL